MFKHRKQPPSPKGRVFYGYWILTVAFLYLFIYSGLGVGAFSLFVKPLQTDFGWGRGEIMVAFTIFFALTGLALPGIGSLIDRYGVRGVISVGALVTGLGFVSLMKLQSIWHFYIAYMVIGVGMTTFGPVPASAVVANWFKRRRGMLIGIVSAGLGAGILVYAQLLGSYVIPVFGWRTTYLVLGISAWVPIILTLLFVRTKPEEMGLRPDGIEAPQGMDLGQMPPLAEGLNLKAALKTSAFWLLLISYFIGGYSAMGISQNQVPHLQDIGFPLSRAAVALTGLGLGSAIGKFLFGLLCDRIQAKYAWAISLFLLAGAVVFLLSLKATSSMSVIWLYAICNGLGNGGWLPTMSILVNVNFGLVSYGVIFGMASLADSIGCALGPLMAGYMYDAMQTYRWAFLIFLISDIIALLVILAVRRPKRSLPSV